MPKRVAILQSNYIPWKGYFDLIRSVDEFILFDNVQYTRQDWRNRNKIKTPTGTRWLTVPVIGKFGQTIDETVVSDLNWGRAHWQIISHNYRSAPFLAKYADVIEAAYLNSSEAHLNRINYRFLKMLCGLLNISTKISRSTDYTLIEGKTSRLVSLCQQAKASQYLSGPAAKDYLESAQFQAAGLELRYVDYSGYPQYPQLFPPFEHAVSILDLLFNTGPDAVHYMKVL